MVVRLYHLLTELVAVIRRHDRENRVEILTGMGILHSEPHSHIHVRRENAQCNPKDNVD